MIADTTFVSDLLKERLRGKRGAASRFCDRNRPQKIRTTIITAGEILVMFDHSADAWDWIKPWTVYRLHPGIVTAAADIDRELGRRGQRLGENDNWIAGYARYYREPVVSRDEAFDRAPGVRRIPY
jgi:predicted nucleic acid-binding protein